MLAVEIAVEITVDLAAEITVEIAAMGLHGAPLLAAAFRGSPWNVRGSPWESSHGRGAANFSELLA